MTCTWSTQGQIGGTRLSDGISTDSAWDRNGRPTALAGPEGATYLTWGVAGQPNATAHATWVTCSNGSDVSVSQG